jgi:hypothetical protein
MSVATGPKIVTSGLLLDYDMNNSRSWKGMPVTNQFAVPVPYNSNGDVTFATNGTGTFRRIYEGTFGGYSITNNDVVYRYDLGAGGCHYHGNAVSIPIGVYPTFTFDFYISPESANYPTDGLLANFENYGGGAQGGGASVPNSTKGIWQTITFSGGLTTSTGTQAMFLYPGGCGGLYLASSGYILYKNPQVIFSATNAMVSPFAGPFGTRSNTAALIDVAQNYGITLDSLTYSTTNTFSFNGSTDFMTLGAVASSGNAARSIFAWVKASSAGGRCIIATGTPATSQAFNLVTFGSNKIGVMGYNNDFYPTSGANIFDNVWHYVGAVANGSSGITTYVDGVQDNTGTITYATAGQTNYVGKSNHVGAESYWNGSIAGVQMYSIGLSATEVAQNFAAQRSLYNV